MASNQNLSKGMTQSDNFVGSRAYTFVDSYIYMKNKNYNALYEKNKEILMLENDAIKYGSPKILYNAFFEQMRILDSVVARMRDFSIRIKGDVISNINLIMPDNDLILEFEESIDKIALLPKFKYVKYNIRSTKYADMAMFFNMFRNEIKEFCEIKDQSAAVSKPLLHGIATKFLTNVAMKYTNYNDSVLELEEIKIVTLQKLINILNFFQKKSQIKQIISEDFKTYDYYLRQYKVLYNITVLLEPVIEGNDIIIEVQGKKYKLTFNDYLVLYKHFSAIAKYLLDIVNYYNSKFFNKLYAIQSNIEVYRNIMRDVVNYAKNEDIDIISETTNSFNDLYGLINGNTAAAEFLMDDVNDYADVIDDEDEQPDNIEPDNVISNEKDLEKSIDDINNTNIEYSPNTYNTVAQNQNRLLNEYLKLESIHPIDIINNKSTVMHEAVVSKLQLKKTLDAIIKAIEFSIKKFKDISRELKKRNADWIEQARKFDLNKADLSDFREEMFPYWMSIPNKFNNVRIPDFTMKDEALYEGDGTEFMNKYFKDIIDTDGGVSKNIFRGLSSSSNKNEKYVIEYGKAKGMYKTLLNMMDDINKLRDKVAKDMEMISDTVKRVRNMNTPMNESVLLQESIFKDEYFDILLEATTPDQIEKEMDEDDPNNKDDKIEVKREDNRRAISVDKQYKLVASWSKMCTSVTTAEMDVLDEAYGVCVKFINKVMKSAKK